MLEVRGQKFWIPLLALSAYIHCICTLRLRVASFLSLPSQHKLLYDLRSFLLLWILIGRFFPSARFQEPFVLDGGDEEDRTPDPLLAKQVLSQLSYTPKGFTVSRFPFLFTGDLSE